VVRAATTAGSGPESSDGKIRISSHIRSARRHRIKKTHRNAEPHMSVNAGDDMVFSLLKDGILILPGLNATGSYSVWII
jgi:hypothetical protein